MINMRAAVKMCFSYTHFLLDILEFDIFPEHCMAPPQPTSHPRKPYIFHFLHNIQCTIYKQRKNEIKSTI